MHRIWTWRVLWYLSINDIAEDWQRNRLERINKEARYCVENSNYVSQVVGIDVRTFLNIIIDQPLQAVVPVRFKVEFWI